MFNYQQRHALWQKYISRGVFLPVFILVIISSVFLATLRVDKVSAATSNTLNYQARLLTASGGLVPDGSYNIEFKIYDSLSSGASAPGVCSLNSSTDDCWWRESRTVSVQNGYFSIYLGDTTAGGTAFTAGLPWDQELWLTMNVNSDGEMSPRLKLTAVPYAFRAGALVDGSGNAKTADQLAQLAPTSVQGVNAAIAALRINQTGSGALLQLQGNGADVFTLDKNGNTVLGAGITVGNSSSTTAGTIRWNGSAFQGFNGTTWASLGSSAVMPFVSKTKTADETQNNTVNPTATLQNDDHLFFSVGANETWNFRFVVLANANATPDIKFAVTAPVGATCKVGTSDAEGATSVSNLGCGVSTGLVPGNTTEDVYEVVGSVTNGANAGTVTLQWAQNTANAANVIVRSGSFVEASRSVGGSSVDVAFIQNGNSFGTLAVLGTNDANGLAFETNGVERLQIQSGGDIQAKDDLIANRTTTGVTGTTTGIGSTTTTLTLLADSFNLNDVIYIDNAAQDYYTRITNDPGTGTYTVSPAVTFETGRTVTGYTVQNIGATIADYSNQANRFFQGYFLGGVVVGAGTTTISDGSIMSTTTLNLQASGGNVAIGGGLSVTGAITGDGSGLTNIDGSSVDGTTLTSLNASNISSGTLADARLSSNVTLLGNTFNGNNQLVRLDGSGNLPALNGAALTSLNAGNLTGALAALDGSALTSLNGSNIASGTVADARLSANVTLQGNTFNGVSQLVRLDGSGNLPVLNGAALTNLSGANITGALAAVDGSALTSLNASNISSGTLNDARLSANVTLLGNTFNGVSQLVRLDGSGNLPVINGAALTNLSAGNLTGALAALDGSALTSLNASNISSGTIADGRLSTNVTLLGNTFNGVNQLVRLNGSGNLPALNGAALTSLSAGNLTGALAALDGSALTSLNGSNIASGTVADARLSTNVTLLGNTFNGNNQLVRLDGSGNLPILNGAALTNLSAGNLTGALAAINGSALTSLNATNIASGTLADGRLSANVVLLSGSQTFTGTKDFSAGLTVSSGNVGVTGSITGTTIIGNGAGLTNLEAGDIGSGTLADARLSTNVVLLSGSQTFTGTKTFTSGAVAVGQTTLSSAATVARAVSFPDEAGTVCLSNSNTCGYLRLAAGAVQTDASNNDVLAVNKTSATGNLVLLQRSGTAVFTVANSGALQIQATGTAALDIRNVGGTSYFSVDTNTGIVRVGPAAADATGVLFVLDTKNTAGDPTGVAGATYYNSAQEQFRCYRGGVWEACSSNPIERQWVIEDEFMSGYTGGACTTTLSIVGDVNWACFTSGTATTAYNVGTILPTADHPGIIRMTTAAANGNGFTMAATGNNSGSVVLAANQRVQFSVGQGTTITNNILRTGLHAQTTTNARPTTGVWWEADASTNANWQYCFGTGAAATCASSGVAVVANTLYSFDIRITAVGAGTSSAVFTINGTSFTVSGVTIGTAARVNPAVACFNSTAAARECFVDYFRASGTTSARR